MTGQMFKPLGFTIVFCMSASLLSAMTVVPLCYLFYKPSETKRALMGRPIERLQKWYRGIMDRLLNHKAMVMGFSVLVLVLTVILASGMQTELMTSDVSGYISLLPCLTFLLSYCFCPFFASFGAPAPPAG